MGFIGKGGRGWNGFDRIDVSLDLFLLQKGLRALPPETLSEPSPEGAGGSIRVKPGSKPFDRLPLGRDVFYEVTKGHGGRRRVSAGSGLSVTFPRSLKRLALVDISTPPPTYRLPSLCPSIVVLDWLKEPDLSRDPREGRLEQVE